MTTEEAIKYLKEKEVGTTLLLESNTNIHIFKNIMGVIHKGEYGNGSIIVFDYHKYENETWTI